MGYIQRWFGMGRDEEAAKGGNTSPFDAIRHEDMRGEYWLARELAPRLGYTTADWRYFAAVVGKAKSAIESIGFNSSDHIGDVTNMVDIGSRTQREVADFRLDRRACYMVAMCGDPRKVEVAAAKNYFATKTREAELAGDNPALNANLRRWAKLNRTWQWIDRRMRGMGVRSSLEETLAAAGIEGWGYSHLTRNATKKLTGKYPVEIREEHGVKNTRDAFTVPELVNMMFAESLASQAIEKEGAKGYRECKIALELAAENTRRAVNDSLGGKAIPE